jgi:UDPglucose 6-dehydrogenase
MKVGIIGNGFVGEAQAFAFSPTYEIKIYDVDPLKSINTLDEVHNCEVVFVCVPSPMNEDGSQNLTYIEDVFDNADPGPVYVIKSTVIPGTTRLLQEKYKDLSIVFSPEFLTQRTAKLDMMTQARVIFGGDDITTGALEKFYSKRFKNRNYIHTDPTTAELIKYMNNTFFATKVSFMNEFKILANKLGVDWETAVWGFASDHRLGDSHLDVPGPDGKLGFGGTCFPKDINAIIDVANSNEVDMKVLKAAWETNLKVRPEKDWEQLKGKAVV